MAPPVRAAPRRASPVATRNARRLNVWAYERCGAGAAGGAGGGAVDCETNPVDPVFKFDRNTGAVLANFGKGVMVTPHGISIDKDGNVWVDGRGSRFGIHSPLRS